LKDHSKTVEKLYFFFVSILLSMLLNCSNRSDSPKVAKIDGVVYTINELDSYIKSRVSIDINDIIRNEYLNDFIDSMVIDIEIDQLGIHKLYAVTGRLELYRINALSSMLRNNYIEENIYTYENFDSLNSEMEREFDLSQIFIGFEGLYGRDKKQAKVLADSIHRMIPVSGFGQLARNYSDDESTKVNGGRMGRVPFPMMNPVYQKSVDGLDDGDYTTPIETRNGYIIVKLNKKRISPVGHTDQNINHYRIIVEKIWGEKVARELNQYMTELKKKYEFSIDYQQTEEFLGDYYSIADTFHQDEKKQIGFSKKVLDRMENKYKLARIDGRVIDLEWILKYQDRYQVPIDTISLYSFIDQFTNYEVLVKEAEYLGLDKRDDFEMSYNNYRNSLARKHYEKNQIQKKIDVGEEEINKYYLENQEEFKLPPLYRVIEKPSGGIENNRMEKTRFIGSETMLGKRLRNLKTGEKSPPINYRDKINTYKMVEIIPDQVKLLSEVRDEIISRLQKQKYSEEKGKIIDTLYEKFNIEKYPIKSN
tara:strand:- start:6771 stop:8375 length:1605 start_codon:yes stop_codon:yes gene_type:complete